ncbi:MAG: hypothetical protein LBB56_04125, partial [Chitinispirillales bacterium]|nr:hypothetical protein [Chitinispirillales bacterium]
MSTPNGELRCTAKGTLKKIKLRICAGDIADVRVLNEDSMEGVICGVRRRQSFLPRPPLANLSQVIFINCFKHPKINLEAA